MGAWAGGAAGLRAAGFVGFAGDSGAGGVGCTGACAKAAVEEMIAAAIKTSAPACRTRLIGCCRSSAQAGALHPPPQGRIRDDPQTRSLLWRRSRHLRLRAVRPLPAIAQIRHRVFRTNPPTTLLVPERSGRKLVAPAFPARRT